jgi:uncharacterized membrane protein (DUF2068 family)
MTPGHDGASAQSSQQGDHWLRIIAAFKFLKAFLLVAAAVGGLKLAHKDVPAVMQQSVDFLGLDPGRKLTEEMIAKASALSPEKIKALSLGGFIYAGLFLSEGIGLWLRKRWGEWLTVIITGSLIPFELYEIYEHPTGVRVLALALNLAILAYLIHGIRGARRRPGGKNST